MNNKWIIDNSEKIEQLTIGFESIGDVVMKPHKQHELHKCEDGDKVSMILVNGEQYNGIFTEFDDDDGDDVNLRAFSDTSGTFISIPRHVIYGFFREIEAQADVLDSDLLTDAKSA